MFTGVHAAADVELSERCRFRQELVHTQDLIRGSISILLERDNVSMVCITDCYIKCCFLLWNYIRSSSLAYIRHAPQE